MRPPFMQAKINLLPSFRRRPPAAGQPKLSLWRGLPDEFPFRFAESDSGLDRRARSALQVYCGVSTLAPTSLYMPELRIHARVGPRSLERLHHRPPGLSNSRRCLLTPISIEAWSRTRRPSLQEPMPKSHYTSRWSGIRVLAPLPQDSTWIHCEYDSRAVRRSGRRIIGHGAALEGNVPSIEESGAPEPFPIPNGGTS